MSSTHGAPEALVADLRRVFGERLRSVVTYGGHAEGHGGDEPVTCLALVDSLTAVDLEACARAASSWRRQGLASPHRSSRWSIREPSDPPTRRAFSRSTSPPLNNWLNS